MRKIIFIIPLLLLLCGGNTFAWDGELYLGRYFDQSVWNAEYVGGVKISHDIPLAKNYLTVRPYLHIETYMDEYTGNYFHPFRVRYFTGIDYLFPNNIYLKFEHLCDHPVDKFGMVEQYSLIQIGVKF